MPRKQYLQHLTELLRTSPDSNIEKIRRGEDDGSFVLFYKPPGVEGAIEITGLIPDLSDYPTQHQTYLYTSSADVPSYITDALNSVDTLGLSLSEIIQNITTSLNKVVIQKSGRGTIESDYEDFQEDEDLMSEEEDEEDNDLGGGWSDDEPTHFDDNDAQMNDALNDADRPETLPQLRRDLREAKAAGFRVGVLGDSKGGIDSYISLSVRVSKMGLSEEALNAWKLEKDQYLILLIHYQHYYKPLADLLRHSYHAKQSVQFCVGTSKYYKPTLAEAIGAFSTVQPLQTEGAYQETSKKENKSFRAIFISRPLNELLNNRVIDLVVQRVGHKLTWDGAERFLTDWQGKMPQSSTLDWEAYRIPEDTPANLPAIVIMDSLANVNYSNSVSFPLVAMQFTLRHLVRCTEFCLVCHNKINSNFEALKPYVCSNPLCLYQYMALGFGPSIEYEIISQPTVVDILISFCYASARSGNLTEFPNGMNLLVPSRNTHTSTPIQLEFLATLDRKSVPHTLQCTGTYEKELPVKRGEWIRVRIHTPQNAETCYYRAEDILGFPKIILSAPVYRPADIPPTGSRDTITQEAQNETDKQSTTALNCEQAICTAFSVNFDSMDDNTKQNIIAEMIETIPPVYEMKNWLEEKTTVGALASLKNWTEKISPAACGILRWIIASNRSCIVPVDEVDADGNKVENTKESRVWGMGDYIQFRFAMGAPDKEQRFVKAVKEAQKRSTMPYPTLFAFHGSPLQNWHSIVREGLHFKKTTNGRAYGHGCYHSLSLSTSLYYCSHNASNTFVWPNSCLNVASAICLNEIVNAPSEFVSTTPHLVVAQLDWIQTRYLFVTARIPVKSPGKTGTVGNTAVGTKRKGSNPTPSPIINQDPAMTPQNANGEKLIIPAALTSHLNGKTAERPQVAPSSSSSSSIFSRVRKSRVSKVIGSKLSPIPLDEDDDSDASVETEPGDLLILLSEDEDAGKKNITTAGNKILSKAANLLGIGPAKKKETTLLTDFVPGSLDMTDISLIPPPSYASGVATRRLQAELKAVLRVQESTPLHELGWYINPDSVNNVYQWIFEFHSFDEKLPLAQDMKSKGIKSIVMEARFGSNFPMSPPFVRVIKPRFLGFQQGGGGHVTLGGALCMELLTNNGWSAVSSIESVLLQVRMAMTSMEPRAARLAPGPSQSYGVGEAKEAYIRACRIHNWQVPTDFAAF